MIVWLIASALVIVAVAAILQTARVRRFQAGRKPGFAAFAESYGASEAAHVCAALYESLQETCGGDMTRVRPDDSLSQAYGIVGDDIDELVASAVARLPRLSAGDLQGRNVVLDTPREIVDFLWAIEATKSSLGS